MKKLLLTLLAFGTLTFAGFSQEAKKSAPADKSTITPEQRSENEAARATKKLGLNETQRTQFKEFSMTRITTIKPLREQLKTETDSVKKSDLHKMIKRQQERFYLNVNTILTPEQQTKWAEQKKKMQAKKSAEQD